MTRRVLCLSVLLLALAALVPLAAEAGPCDCCPDSPAGCCSLGMSCACCRQSLSPLRFAGLDLRSAVSLVAAPADALPASSDPRDVFHVPKASLL